MGYHTEETLLVATSPLYGGVKLPTIHSTCIFQQGSGNCVLETGVLLTAYLLDSLRLDLEVSVVRLS